MMKTVTLVTVTGCSFSYCNKTMRTMYSRFKLDTQNLLLEPVIGVVIEELVIPTLQRLA